MKPGNQVHVTIKMKPKNQVHVTIQMKPGKPGICNNTKSLMIPKWESEAVNRRRKDNTMDRGK